MEELGEHAWERGCVNTGGWSCVGDLHDRLLAKLLDGRVVEDLAVLDDAVVALRVRAKARVRVRARVRSGSGSGSR